MSKADILIWCTKRAPQPLNLLSVYRYSNIFRTPMGVPLKIMEVTSLRLRDPLDQSSTGQRDHRICMARRLVPTQAELLFKQL